MRISKERLSSEAEGTGFRAEVLEKVIHLLNLLETLHKHPFLKNRLALKGGTALNLFLFDLPRLSVDIDLNYVGVVAREVMLSERPKLEEAIGAVCKREGFTIRRTPTEHAGGKWLLHQASAIGQGLNLEVDVNFMFRIPLWPLITQDSRKIGSYQARHIPMLDIHELAAGKLCALLARRTTRDLFDAHRLLTQGNLDRHRLRLAFVVYGAMNRKDWRTISEADVDFDVSELKNHLFPMLRTNSAMGIREVDAWATQLVDECRGLLGIVLPFSASEREFLDYLLDHGKIEPSLLTDNQELAERIYQHPGLKWKALNVLRHQRDP